MINPFKDTNWNPDLAERRSFAKSLIIGFPALAAIFTLTVWLKTHTLSSWTPWLAAIGTGRVEGRGEGGGPDSTLRLREPGQPLPIEGVEKVAHVPAGGGLNRGLNRLVGCGGMVAGCWPGGS